MSASAASSQFRVITCQNDIDVERERPGFPSKAEVFLAGCGDDFIEEFQKNTLTPHNVLFYVPRGASNLRKRIKWEHRALECTQIVVFWFPALFAAQEYLPSHSLFFTLGQVLAPDHGNPPIVIVGVHPTNPDREEIEYQLTYRTKNNIGIIAESMEELAAALEYYL